MAATGTSTQGAVVTVGLAQIRVAPGRKAENLARVRAAVASAAADGARIVVLPEAADVGWADPSALQLAEGIPDGGTATLYRELAREHGVYVCGGLVERAGARLFNAALLVDPDGEIRIHHRKIHELDDVTGGLYARGDRLAAAETPYGRIGVMICADALAPEGSIGRALGFMGCRIILSPCAWAVPASHDESVAPYGREWREHYGRIARDFGTCVVGVSNVGPITGGAWAGRSCIGCSLVVGADGVPLIRGPYGEDAEAVLCVELPLALRPQAATLAARRSVPRP
jgi:predicted amidohydrolase